MTRPLAVQWSQSSGDQVTVALDKLPPLGFRQPLVLVPSESHGLGHGGLHQQSDAVNL